MGRAQIKYVVTDQRSGKVIQNAKVFVYTTGTANAVADLFAAPSGGAAIADAGLTSNAQGEVEGYVTTPRNVALYVTDNGDTAYYPATPGITLSWAPFTEDPVPAYEDPVDGELDDAIFAGFAAQASDLGNLGATETLTLANGLFIRGTLNADCVVTMPAVSAATEMNSFMLDIVQDGVGGWLVTFPGVAWSDGVVPITSVGAGMKDRYIFISAFGDAWEGALVAANIS